MAAEVKLPGKLLESGNKTSEGQEYIVDQLNTKKCHSNVTNNVLFSF
jgi:hypothetical protein